MGNKRGKTRSRRRVAGGDSPSAASGRSRSDARTARLRGKLAALRAAATALEPVKLTCEAAEGRILIVVDDSPSFVCMGSTELRLSPGKHDLVYHVVGTPGSTFAIAAAGATIKPPAAGTLPPSGKEGGISELTVP